MAQAPGGGRKRGIREQQQGSRSRGIQSIEIGCKILRALETASGPMALKDIAAAARMAPSKARFYMVSFLRERIVVQDPATGHYSLGPFAIQLGLSALRQSDMVALSREAMLNLRDRTNLSVFLSIWGNRGPVMIAKFEGREQSPFSVRVGYGLPMTTSPTGNIFYTYLPSRETEPILKLEQSGLVWTGARTVTAGMLAQRVAQIRARGYAISEGQVNEGFTAISAPIFSATGELAGAITLIGSNSAFQPASRTASLINRLLTATRDLSAQLGHDVSLPGAS